MSSSYYANYSRAARHVVQGKISAKSQRKQKVAAPVPESRPTESLKPRREEALVHSPEPVQLQNPTKKSKKVSKLVAASRRGGPAGRRNKLATRPSLSEQLAAIGAGASSLTEDLRNKHGLDNSQSILFSTPAISFVVGRLESKLPSPVVWYRHHCAYSFQHPYQRGTQIDMEMRYSDMTRPLVRSDKIGGHVFEFKICAPLSCYGIDYQPGKRDHMVKIRLVSGTDADRVRKDILPKIRGMYTRRLYSF